MDYGARFYDPQIGMWHSIDPKSSKYYSYSPYSYCANNSLIYIDPDGIKIIFVNGYLGLGSPASGAPYWNGINSSFVKGAQNYFNDNSVPYFTNFDFSFMTSSTSYRKSDGYDYAKQHYDEIITGMDPKKDHFEFVSHSMGGAFSEGMMDYLREQGWDIPTAVQMNAWTPQEMNQNGKTPYKYTEIVDITITNDLVQGFSLPLNGNRDIPNASLKIRKKSNQDLKYRHRDLIDSGNELWKTLIQNKVKQSDQFFETKIVSWTEIQSTITMWTMQNPNIAVTIK